MKIVLDTNCLVVCLPVSSPYYCVWEAFRKLRLTLCITSDIIFEYSEVLPRFYNQLFVNDIINELLLSPNVLKTNNYYRWNLILADPDDNKFVDCALNSGADYLVTTDRHFNILKSVNFQPIKVVNMEDFKIILRLKDETVQ